MFSTVYSKLFLNNIATPRELLVPQDIIMSPSQSFLNIDSCFFAAMDVLNAIDIAIHVF